jgi:hypothetical protein
MHSFIDPENWRLPSREEMQLLLKQISDKEGSWDVYNYINSESKLSPLALYKFLKARFGSPNGSGMLFKTDSTDNLTHWHYTLLSGNSNLQLMGTASFIIITVRLPKGVEVSNDPWTQLIANLNGVYAKYAKQMGIVHGQLEKWSLFINPYQRLHEILNRLVTDLEKINLSQVNELQTTATEKERKSFYKKYKKWVVDIDNATALGSTIRMLSPVMGEAFINLLIFAFEKKEFKENREKHEEFIRQQIPDRIKNLYINCDFFERPIDENAAEYKGYLRVINYRNVLLHGNVDPDRLKVGDVYFDERVIPLFVKDESIIKKMLSINSKNAEKKQALADYKAVVDFIAFVLMLVEAKHLRIFVEILGNRIPGINKKNGRLGALFGNSSAESRIGDYRSF